MLRLYPAKMFTQLLLTVILALVSAASPLVVRDGLITLPLTRRMNFTGTKTIIARDQLRATHLRVGGSARKVAFTPAEQKAAASTIPVPATNAADIYTAAVRLMDI